MFIFREIKDKEGLMAAFQMRYQVYREGPFLQHLVHANSLKINVDGYDPFAHHYGLFKVSDERTELMIGYIRIIRTYLNQDISKTISKLSDELGFSVPGRLLPYYINAHFPQTTDKQIKDYFVRSPKFEFCEPGSFIILPEFRSYGLAQFIINSTMTVICTAHAFSVGFIDCRQSHKTFYERNGFEWIAVEESPAFPENPWHLLAISSEGAAKRLPDLEERIRLLKAEGQLVLR